MKIAARFIAPLIAAAAAGSIVLAPTAAANAKPTPRTPNGSLFSNAWLPGYGRGHLPPMIAMD